MSNCLTEERFPLTKLENSTINVALTDHQIQISHVILFQNELHFQGKRILMRQSVSFSAFKSRGIKENKNNNETEARQYKKNSFLYLTKT